GILNAASPPDDFGAAFPRAAVVVPTITATSSIIAGNAPNDCAGTPPSSGGTNIEGAKTCALTAGGDHQSTDPLLDALADNGGPTPTRALLTGSPAIDAAAAG